MKSEFRLVPILVGLIVIGGLLFKGCQEGPFGRKQLVTMSPEQEYRLGVQAFRQVLSKSDVLSDREPIVEVVRQVGNRLARAAEDPELRKLFRIRREQKFGWEFEVVRSKEVNAFCLPGGKVMFYTGILPVCANEAGLAAVMGHEIGHALARHGAERMAQEQLVRIGQMAAAVSLSDMEPHKQAQILAVLGLGAQVGIQLPYSRSHESEADHIGLLLMARAGYDPVEAIELWQRMDRLSSRRPPEILSTHPNPATRIQQMRAWLPEAMKLYQKSPRQSARPLPLRR